MEDHVPTAFAEVTRCFSSDILEDGKILVGLCTSSGQLLELVNKHVVDSCDIDRDADDIKIFTSYNPVQRYYLIMCKNELLVVKRNEPLCIIKTYENVIKVQIKDKLCLGRPQAVIWTLTDNEPIVTDFVSRLRVVGPQTVPNITTSLSGKLQEMNVRLVKACKLLQEKRKARITGLYQLNPHLKSQESQNQDDLDVLVWGPPFSVQKEKLHPPLQLSKPWRRAHNDKWIVGVPVFNSSTLCVEDVRLRLQLDCQSDLKYETYLIVFPQRASTGAEWMELHKPGQLFQRQTSILGGTSAVVVGVFEEPLFKKSPVVSISGSLLYRQSDAASGTSIQELLDSVVQFKVEDLVQGALQPFSLLLSSDNGLLESDLVSVVVTSVSWQLHVSSHHRMSAALNLSELGLRLVPFLDCWVGNQDGSLAGTLVVANKKSGSEYLLELYAKNTKQALQFVHSLSSQWKVVECKDSPVSISGCVKSLAKEMRLLLTTMKPNSEFAQEKWTEISKQLCSLELATDLSFLSYSLKQLQYK